MIISLQYNNNFIVIPVDVQTRIITRILFYFKGVFLCVCVREREKIKKDQSFFYQRFRFKIYFIQPDNKINIWFEQNIISKGERFQNVTNV